MLPHSGKKKRAGRVAEPRALQLVLISDAEALCYVLELVPELHPEPLTRTRRNE
jgi:hypothetical protein